MKKLNKILIIPIMLWCLWLSFTIAVSENSDCGVFGSLSFDKIVEKTNNIRETDKNESTKFLTIDQQRAIITKDDLNTAILNLQKQCCLRKDFSNSKICADNAIYFNDNALESEYLFNHLFDVIMRRLSWLNWDDDIYKKTKMTTDDKWTERRERINSQAESLKWSTPQTISTKYNQFRSQSSPEKWYDIASLVNWEVSQDYNTFVSFVSWKWEWNYKELSEKVAKALQNYNERTLYDRYKNSCALTEYFYIILGWDRSADKKTTISQSFNNKCNNFVDKQLSWENAYVKLITQRSANLFLSNYIQWYMSYMYERQMNLQKLRKESNDRFLDVVRGTPCLQSKCVHEAK